MISQECIRTGGLSKSIYKNPAKLLNHTKNRTLSHMHRNNGLMFMQLHSTIFSTGGKFEPVSNSNLPNCTLLLKLHSYALLFMHIDEEEIEIFWQNIPPHNDQLSL